MRKLGWRTALKQVIDSYYRKPYDEASANCALFAADCILAITGRDLAAKYRGKSQTVAGYMELLKADGFSDLAELCAVDLAEKPVLSAAVGDVAVIEEQGQLALGVVIGPQIAVYAPKGGVGIIRLKRAVRVFAVD